MIKQSDTDKTELTEIVGGKQQDTAIIDLNSEGGQQVTFDALRIEITVFGVLRNCASWTECPAGDSTEAIVTCDGKICIRVPFVNELRFPIFSVSVFT